MRTPAAVKHVLLLTIATLIIPLSVALATDPVDCALDRGDQLRNHDQIQDQIRDRLHDCLSGGLLLGNEPDRLRTRDRLRDQDCDLICPTAGEVWNRFINRNTIQYRNQFRLNGDFPPNPRGFTPMPIWLF